MQRCREIELLKDRLEEALALADACALWTAAALISHSLDLIPASESQFRGRVPLVL